MRSIVLRGYSTPSDKALSMNWLCILNCLARIICGAKEKWNKNVGRMTACRELVLKNICDKS